MHHLLDELLNGPARYSQAHHFGDGWALVFVLSIFFAELVALYVLAFAAITVIQNVPACFRAILRRLGFGEKEVPNTFLEVIFPADTSKSAFATEQLHILLRGVVKYYGFWDRLAARKKPYSLELAGTRNDGIRYILMIPTREAETVRHNLLSFLPGLKVKQIDDYMPAIASEYADVVELKLAGDFVLPLQDHKALEEHDPVAFLAGHMTKLAPDELIAFQIVATPISGATHHRVSRKINDMVGRISLGKEVSSRLETQRTPLGYIGWMLWYPPLWFIGAMGKLVAGAGSILASIFSSDHRLPEFMNSNRDKRALDNPYELELGSLIKTKLDQHLFEVTIRILVASPDGGVVQDRLNALVGSFQPFSSAYQSIRRRRDAPFSADSKHLSRFRERTLSPHHLSQQTILSASELSDLYHFPNTNLTKTEGFVKSRSRELATPLSIKHSDTKLDVVVGANEHGGEVQPIGMTLEQRQKHTYIIGKTGTGKTTLLKSSIYQDMLSGKGLAVFDPHGDMFRELLQIVPEHRRKDVIVFDPSDREHPVGLNILDPGIEFEDEDDKHEWITSTVLSVFAKLADENQWGPRMEHILRNTTLTALQTPNPSLYTLQRLLTDKKYQKEVSKTLKDPALKQFWDKEFKMMGSMQMSNATAPLTHRLGHFITAKMSRHILLQENSTVRIADVMNDGKILLVNLSKGDIGEDQSFFFGTILTSFIWMAAYQRTKIPEKKRRDFFVYVDEFQNFATPQFGDITSEGRKFHVSLIVSHQNIAQIEDKNLVKIVAGNAHTMICLKANPEDEAFILPYMKPEVEKGDIVNLAPYHFYMKVTGDESEDAFSGQTVPLDVEESEKVAKLVVAHSRKQYATPKAAVEKYMGVLFGQEEKAAKNESDSAEPTAKNSNPTKQKRAADGGPKSPKKRESGKGHEG
jgi:hypothetical protein